MEETSAVIKGIDWELFFFLRAFFLGFCLRMGYDGFLVLRRIWRHRLFFVTLEDFVFWVTGSILMFGLLFQENNGTPRFFALLGVFAGMVLYHVGPSPVFLCVFDNMRKWIRKLRKIIGKKVNRLLQKMTKQGKMNSESN